MQKETGKQKQSTKSIDQYAVSINSLNAGILWCMYVVKGHLSYNLGSNIKELFNVMFPESYIVAQFSLGKTKCRYMIHFGLAPCFKNALIKDVNNSLYYSLSFDESLNSIVQKCQMDINIRYWDNKEKKVKTRYLDSQFLERPNADHLLQSLKTDIKDLKEESILQLAMDGPNINWEVLRKLDDTLVEDGHNKTLNIGSCVLNTLFMKLSRLVPVRLNGS